jgi:8-oxo-dGTP diphosphatase
MSEDHMPEFGTPWLRPGVIGRHAAYAIVRDDGGRVLAVRGPGGLFLPGGGREADETLEEALVREVLEETGYEVSSYTHRCTAVQHFEAGGTRYRMIAEFFVVSLGARVVADAEHETSWLHPEDSLVDWYHESHKWAVWVHMKAAF